MTKPTTHLCQPTATAWPRESRPPATRKLTPFVEGLPFISRRTVEGHLGNVYVKLGVNSKPDLARRLEELRI